MIGLPLETEDDIDGIVELSHRVLKEGKYRGQVTVNLSTFVPRPHTPFQWDRQISMEETLNKQVFIKKRLNHRQISVKWHDKRMSLLEGLLSRGDESVADLIEQAFMSGCRFDGWSEHFRFGHWERAMETCGSDFHHFLEQRSLDALFPWDRIETGVRKDYLIWEAQKAQEGLLTEDCRSGPCGNCGVCDGKSIRIVKANEYEWKIKEPPGEKGSSDDHFKRILFSFFKVGPSRFLSHLEISTALIRALAMAGIPLLYSQGFHPLPKIAFPFATPVGLESAGEYAEIRIASNAVLQAGVIQAINDRLPEGLRILHLEEVQTFASPLSPLIHAFDYEILLDKNLTEDEIARISRMISNFMNALSFLSIREKDRKIIEKDIRPFVLNLELNRDKLKILLTARFGPDGTVRPMEILTGVLGLAPDKALSLLIRKVKTHFSGLDNKYIDK
jgi:radical SAM-linked protein